MNQTDKKGNSSGYVEFLATSIPSDNLKVGGNKGVSGVLHNLEEIWGLCRTCILEVSFQLYSRHDFSSISTSLRLLEERWTRTLQNGLQIIGDRYTNDIATMKAMYEERLSTLEEEHNGEMRRMSEELSAAVFQLKSLQDSLSDALEKKQELEMKLEVMTLQAVEKNQFIENAMTEQEMSFFRKEVAGVDNRQLRGHFTDLLDQIAKNKADEVADPETFKEKVSVRLDLLVNRLVDFDEELAQAELDEVEDIMSAADAIQDIRRKNDNNVFSDAFSMTDPPPLAVGAGVQTEIVNYEGARIKLEEGSSTSSSEQGNALAREYLRTFAPVEAERNKRGAYDTLKIIQRIYVEKIERDTMDIAARLPTQTLFHFVQDFFVLSHVSAGAQKKSALDLVAEFLQNVEDHRSQDARVEFFARFLGMRDESTNLSPDSLRVYLAAMTTASADEGGLWVYTHSLLPRNAGHTCISLLRALRCAAQLFPYVSDPALQELRSRFESVSVRIADNMLPPDLQRQKNVLAVEDNRTMIPLPSFLMFMVDFWNSEQRRLQKSVVNQLKKHVAYNPEMAYHYDRLAAYFVEIMPFPVSLAAAHRLVLDSLWVKGGDAFDADLCGKLGLQRGVFNPPVPAYAIIQKDHALQLLGI
jgi:hypothetical protein